MEYLQTVSMINDTMKNLQNDINNNPMKYLKNDKFNEKAITAKLNVSKKILNDGWINPSDFKGLLDKNVHLKQGDNKCNFYLINNKNKKIGFVKKVQINYIIKNNCINVLFSFVFSGDYLEFKSLLLNFDFVLKSSLDISNVNTIIKLLNNGDTMNLNYYKVVK